MKKNLFYLFALICSMSLFTACSDDDDDTWQQIPQTELSGDKADLTVNGVKSTSGSVQMSVKNESEGILTLKNVIPGYENVPVNVELQKQSGDSFIFAGTAKLNTAPAITKEAASVPAIMTVEVSGIVYLDGSIKVDMKASGLGLYVGTYNGEKLALKYGGSVMIGKTAVLSAVDGSNMELVLQGVVPGEDQVKISNVQPDASGSFSGEATTAANNTVKYSGSFSAATGVLSLELNATLANTSDWAKTYELASYSTVEGFECMGMTLANYPVAGALYSTWKVNVMEEGVVTEKPEEYVDLMTGLFRCLGGALLPQTLHGVTLSADGNITADYVAKPNIVFEASWMMGVIMSGAFPTQNTIKDLVAESGWTTSPKNLAYWFPKDGKIYVKLDIASILATVGGENMGNLSGIIEQVLNGQPAMIKELLKTVGFDLDKVSDASFEHLLGMVKNGFPMVPVSKDGHTYLYLDKDVFDTLFKINNTGDVDAWGDPVYASDFIYIWDALAASGILPEEAKAAGIFVQLIGNYWNLSAQTSEFNLGLDLIAK